MKSHIFNIHKFLFSYVQWVFLLCVSMPFGAILGCAATSPSIEKTDIIAVVDVQRILEETRAGKKLKESFDGFMQDRQVLLELEQQEIKKIQSDLVNQGSVLSESARRQREEKFQQRVREYQLKEAALSRELQEKQQDLMDGFRSNVKQIVSQMAQDRDLSIVVERGQQSSTLYHQPHLDISDDIIQLMDGDGDDS